MFGLMGTSAIMASVFGRGGRKIPVVKFTSSSDDPYIQSLSCNGTITIESIKDGEPVVERYNNLKNTMVEIPADADTNVKISGYVTDLYFTAYDEEAEDYAGFMDLSSLDLSETNVLKALSVDYNSGLEELDVTHNTNLQTLICGDMENLTGIDVSKNTKLTYLYCAYCKGITELNLAANTALQTLNCGGTSITELNLAANTALQTLDCYNCTSITELNLAANTALQTLNCNSCTSITELNLAANTALQTLYCGGTSITELNLAANTALQTLDCNSCTSITDIYYPATNSDVSTAIAGAITNATAADGTVYTDSAADYYNTIADAATAKGWTIEQL